MEETVEYAPTLPRREEKPRALWPFGLLAAGVFTLGIVSVLTYQPKYRQLSAADPNIQAIASQRHSEVDPSFRVTVGSGHKLGLYSTSDFGWWGEVDSGCLSIQGFSGKNLAFYPKKSDKDLFGYTGFGSSEGTLGTVNVSGLTALSVTNPTKEGSPWAVGLVFRNEKQALVIQAYAPKPLGTFSEFAQWFEITTEPSHPGSKIQIQWPLQKP